MRTAGELVANPPVVTHREEPSDPVLLLRQRMTHAVDSHTDVVFRTLRRLGVRAADADDAVQQVFATLARRIAELRPGIERAFALGTAVRVAADYHRSRRRRREEPALEPELELSDHGALSPEKLLDRKRGLAVLDAMLARIPEDQRAVFVLFEIEGLTTSEISELVGIPMGTVGSRLRRARATFEALCAEQERIR